ncbi:hypothetical protein TAMA11512_02810 [Selenomonas sp. TAMA-11512]|nr:hypothetical protein TAMA11512_02810 [Selenomonas sp. TAMA-11512]
MKDIHRVFTIVLDSFGIGAAPDAAKFGDEGARFEGHGKSFAEAVVW